MVTNIETCNFHCGKRPREGGAYSITNKGIQFFFIKPVNVLIHCKFYKGKDFDPVWFHIQRIQIPLWSQILKLVTSIVEKDPVKVGHTPSQIKVYNFFLLNLWMYWSIVSSIKGKTSTQYGSIFNVYRGLKRRLELQEIRTVETGLLLQKPVVHLCLLLLPIVGTFVRFFYL